MGFAYVDIISWLQCVARILFEFLCDDIPVDHVPPGSHIIGTAVLVVQIISMFPNIDAENGSHAVGKRGILVGARDHTQSAALLDQPCPTRTKTTDRRLGELILEGIERTEGGINS